jgi:hypothetical protein
LTGREPSGLDPIRRTAHVVEADLVAEHDRGRVAAVLAADAQVQLRIRGLALLARDAHQAPDPGLVHRDERVRGHQLALLVHPDELADVVPAEAERRLREIVRAEREELGFLFSARLLSVAHRPESIGPTAFEPETINILSAALDEAWYQVEGDKAAYKVDRRG